MKEIGITVRNKVLVSVLIMKMSNSSQAIGKQTLDMEMGTYSTRMVVQSLVIGKMEDYRERGST